MKTFTTYAEKKAKQILNLLQGYTEGIRMTAILILLLMGVNNVWGDNNVKVYCAIKASDLNCYTLKVNANIGDNNTWRQYTMEKLDETYEGRLIYQATIVEKYGGVDALQFQLYDGSTWKSQKQPCSTWTTSSTFANKLYVYDTNMWITKTNDPSYTVYFVNKDDWTGTIKAYAWNSDCDKNKDWSGADMTSTGKTYKDKNIYSITLNKQYASIIFNNGSSQTGDLTLGSTNIGKMYDGSNWVDYNVDPVVTFKANGGTGSDYTQIVKYNTSTALTANTFTRTGYSFNGWKTAANSGTSYADKANVTFKANTTLYAQWTPAKYTITYKDQGGSNFSGTHESEYPTTHTYGTATTLKTASKTGYTFEGWFTNSACTGNAVTSLGATGYISNITLYAKWTEKTYSLTFKHDGHGTIKVGGTTVNSGSTASVNHVNTKPLVATPNTGYNFSSWALSGNNTNAVTIGSTSAASTTIKATNTGATVTANFTPKTYTITLNANGGASNGSATATYNSNTVTNATYPTRTNYRCIGYYTASSGGTLVLNTDGTLKANVSGYTDANGNWTKDGTATLYAQWEAIEETYTITIKANGNGTVSPESVIVNKSITAEVTATPDKGYKFVGWETEGGAQVADKDRFSTINASRTTVTAANAGSVIANFEALLPNTLTLTQQPMYKERPNPLTGAGGNGTEANPYKIYSEEFVRITAEALPEVEGLTAYYKFGDTPEQESNVFDFSDISGSTPTKINVKAYYKKNDAVWGGEVSADSYYFLVLPLPFYVSTVPAGEMSLDQAAGQDILVQFRSDKKATVNLYVQKDNGEREFRERIENTASYNFNYPVPDNSGPCVLRFIAESDELLDGRSFSKYAEVALYQNVTIKVNDPNGLLKKVFLWRGDDVKSEWPGEDFIQTFGTWRVFVVKYPYYDHFVLNDGTSDNQTYDYEIPSEDKCYQLSDTKFSEGGYYNYKLTETDCPSDLMVSDIEDVTIMEGEQIVVMPKIHVGLGYQVGDVEASVDYDNPTSITAMMSGTNVTILGTTDGESNVTVTYKLDNVRIEKKFKVTVTKRTKITIQVKVPTEHGPEADRIGWWQNDKVYVRYWNAQNGGTDQKMNYLTQTDYHYYFEATIPLDDTGKTNFNIFYENRDVDWRYSTNATNVTEDGCYLVYNDGSGDRGLRYEDVRCLPDQYQVRITMGSGKTFTSNIVTAEEDILSFFAPGMNETGYKAGVVMLYKNDKMIATIEPSTFAESNVYTATVNETGNGLTNIASYTGNYYIRTYGTSHEKVGFNNGKGWNSIKDLTAVEKDSVRFTKFVSREGEFYNHYWVQDMKSGKYDGKDVSACVANDYNDDLAGKLLQDKNTTATGDIKLGGTHKTINVRFGYDPRTNYFARAVLLGSEYENYLNMHCDNAYADKNCTKKLPYGNNNNITENKFRDISNWVYERDIYVNITNSTPSASVYVESKSPHVGEDGKAVIYNHLLGYVTNEVTGIESETPIQKTVIGTGTNNGVYLVRVVYDFKTNRIITAWMPQGTIEVSTEKTIDADVLFVRKENEEVPQINLSSQGKIKSLESMFFAIELHRGNTDINQRHQEQYWFTLPFDCKVGSISGVHGYMQIWGIQRYRGDRRAENGWFNPSTTFWEWLTPDDVMHAGEGYLLVFDKKTAPWNEIEVDKTDADGNIIEGQKETISLMRLYFPSTESGFDMQQQSDEHLTRTYQNHTCTIRTANRYLQDSNWKVIGTTSYNNAGISGYTKDSDPVYKELSDAPSFRYQYEYTMSNDNKTFWYKYTPENGQTATYKSFYGYMVQFAGTINWQPIMSETVPDHIAARRYVPANERTSYTTRLELANAAGEVQDLTFVALDEKATIGFDQNKDLNKVLNRGTNIYTFVEALPFAGNTLPMEKATVPVGVRIATAGEYTFRMPDGTDGIAVTLVDNATGTHTNMLMSEYTVTLDAGTIENRFYLVVDPDRTATSVENIGEEAKGDKAKGVEKFLIDGKLFIRTADGIFDAKGQRL